MEVRLEAAQMVEKHLRIYFKKDQHSLSLNSRLITGTSFPTVSVSEQEKVELNLPSYKTSTPIEELDLFHCSDAIMVVERIRDCLLIPVSARLPSLIFGREQITSMNVVNETTVLEPLDGLIRVMNILANNQMSLSVRKAAAEQIIIFIRRMLIYL